MPYTKYKADQKFAYRYNKYAIHESELEEMSQQSQKLNLRGEIGSIILMDIKEVIQIKLNC